MEKSILPIVVIYHCQLTEATAYTSFIQKNGIAEFVVYDNSPADYRQQPGVIPSTAHYYHDDKNGGLSKAYNYGASKAEELGYDWVLLLDQDTFFPEGAWEVYQKSVACRKLMAPSVVLTQGAPFSPCRPTWMGMKPVRLPAGEYSLKEFSVINSGCCVPVALFRAAGGYKESVRLDFSDYQFQRRLRRVSDHFVLIAVEAVQDFSNKEQDPVKLLTRFRFYLEGALQCDSETPAERIKRHVQVLKHSIALTARTKNIQFMKLYTTKYLLHL